MTYLWWENNVPVSPDKDFLGWLAETGIGGQAGVIPEHLTPRDSEWRLREKQSRLPQIHFTSSLRQEEFCTWSRHGGFDPVSRGLYIHLPVRGSVMIPTCKLMGITFSRWIEGDYNLRWRYSKAWNPAILQDGHRSGQLLRTKQCFLRKWLCICQSRDKIQAPAFLSAMPSHHTEK